MNWASEKDLRLLVLSKICDRPDDLARLYQELEHGNDERKQTIQLNIADIAA